MKEAKKIKQNLEKSLKDILAYKLPTPPKQTITTPSKAELEKKYRLNV